MELLTRAHPRVFMAGPPGTGKSTILLRMATKWLKDNNVHVLITWDRSVAASYKLYHHLQQTDLDTAGQVKLVRANFTEKDEVEKTFTELAQLATQGPLYLIADEVGPEIT